MQVNISVSNGFAITFEQKSQTNIQNMLFSLFVKLTFAYFWEFMKVFTIQLNYENAILALSIFS